jgi:hypothetical protein
MGIPVGTFFVLLRVRVSIAAPAELDQVAAFARHSIGGLLSRLMVIDANLTLQRRRRGLRPADGR